MSKCKDEIVVNTLFHKQTRKFRKRQPRKRRRKIDLDKLTERLETLLTNYKSCFSVTSLILGLPRKCMITLWSIVNNWVTTHDVPDRIVVLVKYLIAFRKRASHMITSDVVKDSKIVGGLMTVRYYNKGIEMLQLPKILHSKSVRDTVPQFLSNRKPPRVSYSYTRLY